MAHPLVTLAPGVHRIRTMGDWINAFAFEEPDGSLTLIDCGTKRAPKTIVAALAALGKHPGDVQRIVMTHAHNDHAGGAAAILEQSSATGVHAHEGDATFLTAGARPPLDPTVTAGRVFGRLSAGGFTPVAVAATITDGEVLDIAGGLTVVHTPGHTPGHVSLLHAPTGVLITGDSIFNMNARMRWSYAAFCTSFTQAKETAQRLADLDYRTAAFTHGPQIDGTGREAIRAFLGRAPR